MSFFPLGPLVYVCATLLWGQEGRVHCRVTGCSVCSPGPLSPASSSSEALDEIKLLDSRKLAVWWYGWGCDTLSTFSEPLSTKLMSLNTLASSLSVSTISSDISLGCSNLGLLLGQLIMPPLTPMVKLLLGRITISLCNTGSKLSLKSEKWNATLSSSKHGPSNKWMTIKFCLSPHYRCNSMLRRYTLQTKQLVTHKPGEQSTKNRLCIIATTSLLAVRTVSHKKWIWGIF